MSQYANAVLAERSFPLTTAAYYQRAGHSTNADGGIATILSPAQGPQHQSHTWPQYFTEHQSLTQPSSFTSYATSSDPSSSTATACMPYADIHATGTSVNSAGDASHFHQSQQTFNTHSRSLDYQIATQSPPVPYYPTSSQRTIVPSSPGPQLPTFPPSYGFRNDRDSSPSSHTSASDYEAGAREWDSSGYRSEDLSHQPPHRDVSDEDDSARQIDEVGSRHSSLPASTTTSVTVPSVKIEPDDPDGCFIMELSSLPDHSEVLGRSITDRPTYRSNLLSQSLAPPTEVPLRATQASKEMRGMMGVFRLNPFAMHSLSVNGDGKMDGGDSTNTMEGGKAHALWGGEAHALDEEPVMFEFELNIDGLDGEVGENLPNGAVGKSELTSLDMRSNRGLEGVDQLRSFSPSFSLHPDDIDAGSVSPRGRERRSIAHVSELEYDDDDQEEDSWPETDYGSRSEVDTSSSTTRSVHTPFNDSPLQGIQAQSHGVYDAHHDQSQCSPSLAWDAVNEQYQVDDHRFMSSAIPKIGVSYGHEPMRVPRLHTTTSHPYLRKSLHTHQTTHGHSQSLSQGPAHSLEYVQPQPSPDISLQRLPTHHPEQHYAHISTQNSQNQNFSPTRAEYQSHIPSYPSTTSISGDGENFVGPTPPPYRYIRHVRGENQVYEDPHRVYTPSNASSASNDVGGYPQSSETSMHLSSVNVHGSAMNLASNRRWSLPETGAGIGHGLGNGGSFLGSM